MLSFHFVSSVVQLSFLLAVFVVFITSAFFLSCSLIITAFFLDCIFNNDSETLVMIGAGALAPHLIKAHLSARPSLRRVMIWNRTIEKARKLAEEMSENAGFDGVCFESNECLEEIVGLGDIVSCATNSETPVVKGERLKAGAHLDLVGSFKHSMMECDNEAIRRGRVFVDNEVALVEAGELVDAFERRVIEKGDIGGNLVAYLSLSALQLLTFLQHNLFMKLILESSNLSICFLSRTF